MGRAAKVKGRSKKPKARAIVSRRLPENLSAILLLVALTTIAYVNSLRGSFVFDDRVILLPQITDVRVLGDVLAWGEGWRELLLLTFRLNYYWGGLDTFGYHAVSVVLHSLNTVLVFLIILSVSRGPRFAAIAGAAVFGVHTLFSSAVSYIWGRSSVLCATFYFAAILFFLMGLDHPKRSARLVYFFLTGVAGFLAWQVKLEAVTLPIFLAGVLWLRREGTGWRWIAPLATIPALIVFLARDRIVALYANVTSNQALVSAGFEQVLAPATYIRTYTTAVVGYYFPRFIFPVNLSADPQIRPVEHWYSPEFLFSIVVLFVVGWVMLRFARSERLLAIGLAAVVLSPLAAYAAMPLADLVFEHRAYIPGLGVAFLFAWLFQWIGEKNHRLKVLAPITVVLVFMIMTINRNQVWANDIVLWEDAERKAPDKPRPHFNLGQAYQEAGRLGDAIREYEHALEVKPDLHAAYSNIAAVHMDQGALTLAEEELVRVTELAPEFADGFINLGVLYVRMNFPEKALQALDRAVEIDPDSSAAHFNHGVALTLKRDFRAAVESYERAVSLEPDSTSFRLSLGQSYVFNGNRESAEKEFLSLAGTATSAEAHRSLGTLYSDWNDPERAIENLQQAIRERPLYPEAHGDLGIVYIDIGMYDEAIEELQTSLRQQSGDGSTVLNLALAYQLSGDVEMARNTLQTFVESSLNSGSPFVPLALERLASLR